MKSLVLSFLFFLVNTVLCVEWKHSAILDNNFLVLWTLGDKEVTFEIQVKTLGYVGLGFKKEDGREGVDMVIGWVDNNGQVQLQDRHMKDASKDPEVDSSQDYRLLLGYENKTHTVLRFSRRYDTCDSRDLKITNDTMQVVWQYHDKEPASAAGVLPGHDAVRGSRPLYLVQRDSQPRRPSYNQESESSLKTWDVLNKQVILPSDGDSLLWCRVVKMPNINRKHHVVKYEPVIEPRNTMYLHHMTLYECPNSNSKLEEASKTTGSICYTDTNATQCNTIAATWNLGSEGFNYPPEAGYALYPDNEPRYYMLATLYINPQKLDSDNSEISDSSGLKLYYTDRLRPHDAGILSVGIDPNWRHFIPPGQPEVVSEGHCIAECTGKTIPNSGINMFAVIMHTHQLGKKIRFRQIRAGEELPPIVSDTNYDPSYQEYRKLQRPVKVYPGDHLVAECTYSSESRSAITLGGLMTRQETCLVSVLYYPRIELSICYSLPSLPTVLQSLGVQKIVQDSSDSVKIQEPKSLAGMTLEDRIISYDWVTSFQSFQETTRAGTFMPLCWTSKGVLQGTESLVVHYPRILNSYEELNLDCSNMGYPMDAESDEANAVERGQLVRSKVSRSSEGPTAGSSPSISGPLSLPLILATTLLVGLAAGLR